jgi:hypothetical protein
MDRETKARCRGCKHCWDSQCCNISAHVQRAYGMQGECRFFAEMSTALLPGQPKITATVA